MIKTNYTESVKHPLTPQTKKKNYNNEEKVFGREGYRQLIKNCLDKQMYSTAVFYAEKLSQIPGASISDHVLFAKCFQLSGEYRRCLVTLEHRGLLSAEIIDPICELLKPQSSTINQTNVSLSTSQSGILSAVHLAACCLFHLREPEDTLTLLEPFITVEDHKMDSIIDRIKMLIPNQLDNVNIMAGMYFIAGKCFDILDNRHRCLTAFTTALRIDPACIEIAEYISNRGLLSQRDRKHLLKNIIKIDHDPNRSWLKNYYSFLLDDASPDFSLNMINLATESNQEKVELETEYNIQPISALALVQQAEYMYSTHHYEEAYRLARQAYSIDPYDWRGNLIYVATMVDLGLKNELFYLGHELVHTHPKLAISWYTVACYYWTCKKYELAKKYLQKATKIDKRFSNAWVLLGHVLASQEESEHAISAYRTACRVLPGNHEPQVFMAKELIRTNNYSLALHVLTEAFELCPNDPVILNELGVVYLQLNRIDDALGPFRKAAEGLLRSAGRGSKRKNTTGSLEILSNYATCLRKCGRLENALEWYYQCLAYCPTDAMTHANIGFTLHLSRRFDEAVEQYHRALSLQPSLSICGDMLSQLLEDMRLYKSEISKSSSIFPSLSSLSTTTTPITKINRQNFVDSLIHSTALENENKNIFEDSNNNNNNQSLQFSIYPPDESMNISDRNLSGDYDDNSNYNYNDNDNELFHSDNSQILKSSQDISYLSQVSSSSPQIISQRDNNNNNDDDNNDNDDDQDHNFYYEDTNSVESYSRIAGRLSLDSSSQMSG